jgi:hypothetical protein
MFQPYCSLSQIDLKTLEYLKQAIYGRDFGDDYLRKRKSEELKNLFYPVGIWGSTGEFSHIKKRIISLVGYC